MRLPRESGKTRALTSGCFHLPFRLWPDRLRRMLKAMLSLNVVIPAPDARYSRAPTFLPGIPAQAGIQPNPPVSRASIARIPASTLPSFPRMRESSRICRSNPAPIARQIRRRVRPSVERRLPVFPRPHCRHSRASGNPGSPAQRHPPGTLGPRMRGDDDSRMKGAA
jgi:hypothetical protein